MKNTILILLVFAVIQTGFTQDFKFGKVSKAELEEQFHPLDSTANAAYLFKERKVYYDFNGQQGWTIFTEVHERIKIYSEEGFDYATGNIRLFGRRGVDEKVTSLNAYTFKLVKGKVVKEKLSKKQIFKDRKSDNVVIQKFTMPNIEKGVIVEWKYTTSSPYQRYIDEIELQHDIPINKINVDVKIPEYFVFKQNQKGYLPINVVGDFRTRSVNYDYRSSGASRDLRN